MLFNPEKNFVTWNTETLDTYHDIVISFDYSRYSLDLEPQGGFAVVFFESDADVPTIGGPGYSLGYTPNNKKDYCYQGSYNGLKNAYLGVGFDMIGEFATKTSVVDGLLNATPNSCTIRGSQAENYKHISTSKNLYYTPLNFLIAEKLNSLDYKEFKTIRVIMSKAFTDIEVQIKREKDLQFVTVLNTKLPIKPRTAVKVGVTNTFIDNYTKFELKNFNVAGFPGKVADPEITDCVQTESLGEFIQGNTVVSADNFCAIPVGGNINVYELQNGKFGLSQVIQEAGNVNLLGGNEKFLFAQINNTYDIEIYYRLSNSFFKTQTLELKSEVDPSYLEKLLIPICADTDNRNLAVGDGESVYVFDYITGFSTYGFFGYRETLTDHPSGFIGVSVQVENGKLLTGGGAQKRFDNERYSSFVACYDDVGFGFTDRNIQNIISPLSGNPYNEFGKSIAMQGNEVIIGSPNEFRRYKNTNGMGEVYHYVFARNKDRTGREWRPAMELGGFYRLDTVGGNFGTHLSFFGNNLIVSAPYEMYHFPPDKVFEDMPNVGRVYIFRKNRGGTFSQAAIVSPANGENYYRAVKNMYYGKLVGLYGNIAAVVTVPFKDVFRKGELDFLKIGCVFDIPPPHLEIGEDSYGLVDSSGYIIDMETDTYMQKYTVRGGL